LVRFFFNIPKVSIFLTLILFFISQIQLYFAYNSPDTLRKMDLGLGDLNQEIFGQLSLVSLVIFGLVFVDKNRSKWNKVTSFGLLFETFFLFFMSATSLAKYISSYNLTMIRLYGIVLLILIFGIWVFENLNLLLNWTEAKFVRQTLGFMAILLILVNLLPFQFLIFQFNKPDNSNNFKSVYKEAGIGYDSYNFKTI